MKYSNFDREELEDESWLARNVQTRAPQMISVPSLAIPKTATGSWLLLMVFEIQVVLLDRTIITKKWNKLISVNNDKFLFTRGLQ